MKVTEILNRSDTGTHTHVDENLMELTFHGSTCTKDCSGHRAGYAWSLARGGVQNPASPSQSFVNGSNIGHRMVQTNKQQRVQGGGKIAGYQSQTAQAQKKRAARAANRMNQGVQGSPMDEDNHMRISEFAPSPGSGSGGDGAGMPWNQFAHAAMKWMKHEGFAAHPVDDNTIQFSKHQGDEHDTDYHEHEEDVWLQAMLENNQDGTFNYMMASVTNGNMDPVLDDYRGRAKMDAHGLNHFILLAEEAFGL